MYKRRIPNVRDTLLEEAFVGVKSIRKELRSLISSKFFNKYEPRESINIQDLIDIDYKVRTRYLQQNRMLIGLFKNQRSKQRGFVAPKQKRNQMRKRIIIVTAIAVHSIAKKEGYQLLKALGIFLVSSSTKRRLIEVLNNFGITSLYRSIQRIIDKNAIV